VLHETAEHRIHCLLPVQIGLFTRVAAFGVAAVMAVALTMALAARLD
jgi:uncharacterized membrane protein YphA (DoxX/SURF4 family)